MNEAIRLAIKLAVVAIVFFGLGALVGRADYVPDPFNFLLPAIIAYPVNGWIISKALPEIWGTAKRVIAVGLGAAVAAFLTFWAYMVYLLNIYGA